MMEEIAKEVKEIGVIETEVTENEVTGIVQEMTETVKKTIERGLVMRDALISEIPKTEEICSPNEGFLNLVRCDLDHKILKRRNFKEANNVWNFALQQLSYVQISVTLP